MRRFWPALTGVSVIALMFVSCTTQTTVQNIYVQDIQLKGPVNQSPVYLTRDTKPHQWRIIPRVEIINTKAMNGQVEGHTAVNSKGIFQVDTLRDNQGYILGFEEPRGVNVFGFRGKNLDWSLPGVNAALDFDYTLGRDLSIVFGLNYAMVGQKDFWGFRGGIGLHSEGEAAALRIDVGAHVQTLAYEAKTVITSQTGTSRPNVVFFSDRGSDAHVNPYAAMTINSTMAAWPVNFFVQLAVNSQDLIDFKPTEVDQVIERDILGNQVITSDMRADKTVTFISVTPGLSVSITPSARLLVGARIVRQMQLEDISPHQVVWPIVQVDFTP
jgi:hypothetical protein